MNTDPIDAIRLIQSGLDSLGHTPGAIDGQWGVRTARALKQLIAANGRAASVAPQRPLPWITEAKTAHGRNEARERSWQIGLVAVWCRFFDRVMCSKGDGLWAQSGRKNFARMRCGSR